MFQVHKSNVVVILGLIAPLGFGPNKTNAATPEYTVTDIGSMGCINDTSVPTGINASGQIVGYSSVANVNHTYAFLYDSATNARTDINPIDGRSAMALAVNDAGQAVGSTYTNRQTFHQFNPTEASLFSNFQSTNLGTLGSAVSTATGINNAGQIVGTFVDAQDYFFSQTRRAFLYSNGQLTNISAMLSQYDSVPSAINDSGQITGFFVRPQLNFHAFLYSNGVSTDLGTVGGDYSDGKAINQSGQVVGASTTSLGQSHAFLYANGLMHDLGTLGGNQSNAYAINDKGQIVGYSDGIFSSHGMIYSNGVMRSLDDLVSHDTGWSILRGNGINNAGQIAAEGFNVEGTRHALLLTPNVAATVSPSVPKHLIISQSSGFQADLRWSPVPGASDYDVYVSSSAAGPYTLVGSVAYATNYSHTNLTPSTTYFYQVVARNSFGSSPACPAVSVLTAAAVPQTRPAIELGAMAASHISVTWTHVPSATFYRISRSTSPHGPRTDLGSVTGLSYDDTNVTPNTGYYYYVTAWNSAGAGPESIGLLTFSTSDQPLAPAQITAVPIGSTEIVLTWSPTALADEYAVYRDHNLIAMTKEVSYQDVGLAPGTHHTYTVRPGNAHGAWQQISIDTRTALAAPTNVTAASISAYQINLSWTASPGAASYQVYRSNASGSFHTYIGQTTTTHYADIGLTASTAYYYLVVPSTHDGPGTKSVEVTATTFAPAIPDALSHLRVTAIGHTQITLAWTGGGATRYSIFRSNASYTYHTYIGQTTSQTYTNTGLTPGATYYYIVVPTNDLGNGPKSAEVSATTATLPFAPTHVVATPVTKNQISLTWSAAEAATSYLIFRGTAQGQLHSYVATTTTPYYNDTQRTPETSYFYIVVGVNSIGSGPKSAEAMATTPTL